MDEIWLLAAWMTDNRGAGGSAGVATRDNSHNGMLLNAVIELSVRLSVSYVPWCDARFSMTGIARPTVVSRRLAPQLTSQVELALFEGVEVLREGLVVSRSCQWCVSRDILIGIWRRTARVSGVGLASSSTTYFWSEPHCGLCVRGAGRFAGRYERWVGLCCAFVYMYAVDALYALVVVLLAVVYSFVTQVMLLLQLEIPLGTARASRILLVAGERRGNQRWRWVQGVSHVA